MKLFKSVVKINFKFILFYVIIGVVINFLNLYIISYYQKILDLFQYGGLSLKPLIIYGLLLVIVTVLAYFDNYPEQKVINKLYLDYKLIALKKLQVIDYLEYQKLGTGKTMQVVEVGASAARDIMVFYWLKIFRWLLPTIIFSIYFILKVKYELVIFLVIGYFFVILVSHFILKKLYSLKEKILFNQELFDKHLVRGFMEMVVFRTNKKYNNEIKICENGIKNIVDSKTKIKIVHELFFSLFELMVNIMKIIILVFAILNTNLSVGAIVTLISLLGKAYEPIAIFNVEYIDYKLNKIDVDKFVAFLELKDDFNLKSGNMLELKKGIIEFKNVSFSYENKKVINNVSFKLKQNETISLVGESGSGKSTLVKLIMGLLKTKDGSIYIDGNDLSLINLEKYYDYVSYISQDVPIFDGTLKENLIFDKKISDKKIKKVLSAVCLDDFYNGLENGLDTELGEKGIKMSGGEKQRLALARLFFDDSKIVILDEATSALDTEKKVIDNLFNLLKNRTMIIIAHRLEIIKDVSKILVMKNGNIVEEGKYFDLINKNGYFKELVISNDN